MGDEILGERHEVDVTRSRIFRCARALSWVPCLIQNYKDPKMRM